MKCIYIHIEIQIFLLENILKYSYPFFEILLGYLFLLKLWGNFKGGKTWVISFKRSVAPLIRHAREILVDLRGLFEKQMWKYRKDLKLMCI